MNNIPVWCFLVLSVMTAYFSTVWLLALYAESKEIGAIWRRRRLKEIKRMHDTLHLAVNELYYAFDSTWGGPKKLYSAVRMLSDFTEVLADCRYYEHRREMCQLINRLRDPYWTDMPFDWQHTVRPGLAMLENWLLFARDELEQQISPNISDPFSPEKMNFWQIATRWRMDLWRTL